MCSRLREKGVRHRPSVKKSSFDWISLDLTILKLTPVCGLSLPANHRQNAERCCVANETIDGFWRCNCCCLRSTGFVFSPPIFRFQVGTSCSTRTALDKRLLLDTNFGSTCSFVHEIPQLMLHIMNIHPTQSTYALIFC